MMNLTIKNFKCFHNITVPLNRLTVLAGANGAGKSTCIQSILLLRRTLELLCARESNRCTHDSSFLGCNFESIQAIPVPLNGPYCLSLGDIDAIVRGSSEAFQVALHESNTPSLYPNESKTCPSSAIESVSRSLTVDFSAHSLMSPLYVLARMKAAENDTKLPILNSRFYYLNTERLGPRVRLDYQYLEYPFVGYKGEHTAQVLHTGGHMRHLNASEITWNLLKATNFWLDKMLPGVNISASIDNNTLSSQIRIGSNYAAAPSLATNMGFGVSYLLPIIVNGLIASKESVMIVENPEAHLHPAAQTQVGEFLAKVANDGVCVIIETHSEHVLNGIQLAVVRNHIKSDLVAVNFFNQSDNEGPKITNIAMSRKGELTEWPTGFFDQTQRDISNLFRERKNNANNG